MNKRQWQAEGEAGISPTDKRTTRDCSEETAALL